MRLEQEALYQYLPDVKIKEQEAVFRRTWVKGAGSSISAPNVRVESRKLCSCSVGCESLGAEALFLSCESREQGICVPVL